MVADFAEVGIHVPGGRSGNVKVVCPQCGHSGMRSNPRDKSLSVNVDEGVWHCHYCGFKGGLKAGGVPGLMGRHYQPKVYAKPKPLPAPAPLTPRAKTFFEQRKISAASLDKYGVTELDGALKFPYTRGGELVNVKTRYPGKKFAMEAECELIFWGMDHVSPTAEQAVIVEGEPDVLACDTAGVPNVISVPNGASTGAMAYMDSGKDLFDRCHTVIIAVDSDEPGQLLETELARRIGKGKCCRVRWPEGCKDANDVLMQHGPERLRQCLADAEPFPVEGARWLSEYIESAIMLRRTVQPRGASTGWRSVDELYTVAPGELTVVTGVPGSGKSEWLDALLMNLAQFDGWSFAAYSPENAPGEQHTIKLASKYLGKPYWPGPTPEMSDAELRNFGHWAGSRFLLLDPERPTIETLCSLARVFVFRNGIRGLVIDPWNRLNHARPSGMNVTEYTREALSVLSAFKQANDVHIWLVAHPKKMEREDGKIPVPTPYDISDSAHFFNMADNCITVARDKTDESAPVEIHVQKIRFQRIGKVGTALLRYDRVTGRYHDYMG